MRTPAPDPDVVLSLFREGVTAFAETARSVDLERSACGTWSGAELVRHVASVAELYHEWLDRALDGDASSPFPPADFPRRNDEAIHALAHEDTEVTLVRFVERAEAYADRVRPHWDLPFGYPPGTVTAGLHAGAGATEWHLHTWDLARSAGRNHRPSAPAQLFRAVGSCVAAARGGAVGQGQALLVALASPVAPWRQLRRASGRPHRR